MAIQKKLPRKPTDVICVALSLIQKWCPRLKEKDENKMIQLTESISTWLNDFKPSTRDILDNPHSPHARTPYKCSHTRAYAHLYERTHACTLYPYEHIGKSRDWRSHHMRLTSMNAHTHAYPTVWAPRQISRLMKSPQTPRCRRTRRLPLKEYRR